MTAVDLARGSLETRGPDGRSVVIRAPVIVGADGAHSVVARAAGVARPVRLEPRIGLTYHLPDPDPAGCRDARMRVLHDGYVGHRAGGGWPRERRDRAGPLVASDPRPRRCSRGRRRDRPRHPADPRRSGHLARQRTDRRGRRRLAARPSRDAACRTRLAAGRRRRRLPRPVHRGGPPPRTGVGRAGRGGHPRAPPRTAPAPSVRTTARCSVGSSPRTPSRGWSRPS